MNSHNEFTYKDCMSSNDTIINPIHNEQVIKSALYIADKLSTLNK